MGLKKCKDCGEEVSSGAKLCPKCGKDQRNFFLKHKVLTFIMVIVLFAIIASIGSNNKGTPTKSTDVNNSQENTSTGSQSSIAEFKIGESFKTKKFEITVVSVKERSSVGGEYFRTSPAEGGTFVAVDIKFKNITNEPISSFNMPSVNLLDEAGTRYSSDSSASSYYATETDPDRKFFDDINPQITVKESYVFEVSKDGYKNGTWKIAITADQDAYVKIK